MCADDFREQAAGAARRAGPLGLVRALQLAGLGPVAFCGQLLSDLGADVLRIDPPVARLDMGYNGRGRRSVLIDLKHPDGVGLLLELAGQADALLEGFRPGVAERLGIGPEVCRERNDRLIYARCSGFGRSGPLAGRAAHDLSYLALAGTLSILGEPGSPPPALLGLLGDRGGGGMLLALGIVSALLERATSQRGQVVDTSILDGALAITGAYYEALANGDRTDARWSQGTDGAAPFYSVYRTSDDRYVAISAMEPEFYRQLLVVLELDAETLPAQYEQSAWPEVKSIFAARIATRTRDEWCRRADGTDACLAPVLTLSEAPDHPQHRALGMFISVGGKVQPGPVPHFSRTRLAEPALPPQRGEHTRTALVDWGLAPGRVDELLAAGVIYSRSDRP